MYRLSPKFFVAAESQKYPNTEVQRVRDRLQVEPHQDPRGDIAQRLFLKYLGICDFLAQQHDTDDHFELQSVWTCAIRPSMPHNSSLKFKSEALHCWFNLAATAASPAKAVAILMYIKNTLAPAVYPREVPPFDFQDGVLDFSIALLTADVQAALAEKASATSALKPKLLAETVRLYEDAKLKGEKIQGGSESSNWKRLVESERLRAIALLHFFAYKQAEKEVKKNLAGFGLLIKYLNLSLAAVAGREAIVGKVATDAVLMEAKEEATAALSALITDNNFVYHERIPETDEIPEFPRVHACKFSVDETVAEVLKESRSLIDASLLAPAKVLEIVRSLQKKLDTLKLPNQPEVVKRVEALIVSGALDAARTTVETLEASATYCDQTAGIIRRNLAGEAEEDAQIRHNFRVNRSVSSQLTAGFAAELTTLQSQVATAREKNRDISMKLLNMAEFSDFFTVPSSSFEMQAASASRQTLAAWLASFEAERASLQAEVTALLTMPSITAVQKAESQLTQKINATLVNQSASSSWARFQQCLTDLETMRQTELKQGSDFFTAACSCLSRLQDDVTNFCTGRALEVQQLMATMGGTR